MLSRTSGVQCSEPSTALGTIAMSSEPLDTISLKPQARVLDEVEFATAVEGQVGRRYGDEQLSVDGLRTAQTHDGACRAGVRHSLDEVADLAEDYL